MNLLSDYLHKINDYLHSSLLLFIFFSPKSSDLIFTEEFQQSQTSDDFSVTACAGRIAAFLLNFEKTKEILKNMKGNAIPNSRIFIIEIIDCVSKIHQESFELLEFARKGEVKIFEDKDEVQLSSNVNVAHDPGKRAKHFSQEERVYLTSLGPYQPKMSIYPINQEIPQNKQHRFNPAWYRDYPMLEYSIDKDAAFCFSCSLFPQSSQVDSDWVGNGIRFWHKMKSRGTKKMGKLQEHFTSRLHQKSLTDYCHFLNKKSHVNILLNQSLREKQIKENKQKEFHEKVLEVLIDIARTLARQGLSFQGHDCNAQNDNGNFQQIVRFVSCHCPVLKKWLDESEKRPRHVIGIYQP